MAQQEVYSPLPGIFYRRPSPDAEPFKQEGDTITAGEVIGLVEVMKQFSEIVAEVSGRLVKFTVEDTAAVDPGQVIAIIEG